MDEEAVLFLLGLFIGLVIAFFVCLTTFNMTTSSAVPDKAFKSVCLIQGGVPYDSGTYGHNDICIKGGQVIPVPVVK